MAPRRVPMTAAFGLLLAIAMAGDPALTWLHALDHLAPAGAVQDGEHRPGDVPEGEAECELCQSLSRTRDVLHERGLEPTRHAGILLFGDPFTCPPAPTTSCRTPASPRAPPTS